MYSIKHSIHLSDKISPACYLIFESLSHHLINEQLLKLVA